MNTYNSQKNVISKDSEGKSGKRHIFDKGRAGPLGLKCKTRRRAGNSGQERTWPLVAVVPAAAEGCAQGAVCLPQILRREAGKRGARRDKGRLCF